MINKQSPRLSIESSDASGKNALHTIASSGDISIFKELLNRLNKDIAMKLLK